MADQTILAGLERSVLIAIAKFIMVKMGTDETKSL
jgi:hypothetical protein